MDKRGRILMVEDNAKDVELTLTALEEYNLADEVVVVRDGRRSRGLSLYRGAFQMRSGDVRGNEGANQLRSDHVRSLSVTSLGNDLAIFRRPQLGHSSVEAAELLHLGGRSKAAVDHSPPDKR